MEGLLGGTSTALLCILLVLAGPWVWIKWKHRRIIRVASKLPYSHRPWPILGHTYVMFWGIQELTNCVMDITMTAVQKGLKISCFWAGPLPLIAVHDADDIQTILNGSTTLSKGDEYQMFKGILDCEEGLLDQALLTAPASDWKIRRRYLSLLVHQNNLCHLVSMYNQNSRDLVGRIAQHVGQGPFNVMDHTMKTALKAACDLLFGPDVDIDMNTDGFRGLMHLLERFQDLLVKRILLPWLRIDLVFKFIYGNELKQLSELWRTFSKTPIKLAKESSERKIKNNGYLKPTSKIEERLNIVDVFTAMQQKYPHYSEIDLNAEILMFYFTGMDTIGIGTASCLLALAQYQDIQDKLYSEISSVVGPDDDVTVDDISKMPFLDQVIKETLRRFTLVPFILRKCEQDLKLSTCVVPAGNTTIVSLVSLLLDPKTYPDPYKFDPERFAPENTSTAENKSHFLPFSGGPRNCIAKTYALQLIKVMLVYILRRFRTRTQVDIQNLNMRLLGTYFSIDGYQITVEEREENLN